LLPYALDVEDKSNPPDRGNNTNGSSEVIGIGIASFIHHVAIHNTEQNIANESLDMPLSGPIKK
tara:strand:- start:376 stop:567 length:192 start_codon:yes stop_codon:yes gene_type:complete